MEKTQAFKIVIVYENSPGAIRAKEMAERLATQMESECDSWPFELLAVGRVREHAATMASEADMIIVACNGQDPLPNDVVEWVEGWLPQKRFTHSGLVALLGDEGKSQTEPPMLCAYLEKVAERGNMDFICNLGRWWQQEPADTIVNTPEGTAAYPKTPEYSAARGWGIND